MTMPQMNRHVVGVSALALLLAALGYIGGAGVDQNRRAERLLNAQRFESPSRSASISNQQQNPTGWESRSLAEMGRAPMIERRSAANAPDTAQQNTQQNTQQPAQRNERSEGASGWLSSIGSAASAAKNWSKEDWDIAARAVSEHRSAAKSDTRSQQPGGEPTANETAAQEPQVWQPPEEIAHKAKPAPAGR